jgi:hypothetical protein
MGKDIALVRLTAHNLPNLYIKNGHNIIDFHDEEDVAVIYLYFPLNLQENKSYVTGIT